MVLLDARGIAFGHQPHGFGERIDSHGEEVVEVEPAHRLVGADDAGLLEQDRPGIDPIVRPENRKAGLLRPEDDGPVHRRRAAVQRQQAGVVLDASKAGFFQYAPGDDVRDKRHHAQVDGERAPRILPGGLLQRCGGDWVEPG
ncbi:MAG TPA: hypothetical protein PJ994_12865, partial [Tepidiformaceae bacterium]|nr:hypothetical protein [Tepidiformaceae bacterium]